MNMIELNGAQGEGGGQILRSALTLSMLTGQAFTIKQIRARRAKPGLLRQHLAAVAAATAICGAEVEGAALGSTQLRFVPGPVRAGDYQFAIGSAGSCALVLQTVLPALWFAGVPSSVSVSGGTHNPAAPPLEFLQWAWLPVLQQMGIGMQLDCPRYGFYPAGGGQLRVQIQQPVLGRLQSLNCAGSRGPLLGMRAIAVVAGVPADVAQRELAQLQQIFGDTLQVELCQRPSNEGPGNVVLLVLDYAQHSEVCIAFGARGVAAETVAARVAAAAQRFLSSSAVVGEHLADQLVLPLALAGGGSLTTTVASSHLQTQLQIIERFLPICSQIELLEGHAQVTLRATTDHFL